jgi:hypothetical protein
MPYRCHGCNDLCRDPVNRVGLREHRKTAHRHQPRPGALEREEDDIDEFFKDYPDFPYDPTAPFWQEFRYLSFFSGWPTTREQRKRDVDPKSPQKLAWKAFRVAVVKSFNKTFGGDEDDIDAWGKLCKAAGVRQVPDDLEGRRNVSIL